VRYAKVAVPACLLILCAGCAVFDRHNTPTLNWVEKHLVPDDPTARLLTYPLTIPAGLVAVTADALVVHPASVVDDAWRDTDEVLWHNFHWNEHYATACTTLAPRAVLTPPVVAGDFLARALFAIPERAEKERWQQARAEEQRRAQEQAEQINAHMAKAEELLGLKRYDEALGETDKALAVKAQSQEAEAMRARILLDAGRGAEFLALLGTPARRNDALRVMRDDRVVEAISRWLPTAEPPQQVAFLCRLAQVSWLRLTSSGARILLPAVETLAVSPDKAVASTAVLLLGGIDAPGVAETLRRIAGGQDPTLAALAREVMLSRGIPLEEPAGDQKVVTPPKQ